MGSLPFAVRWSLLGSLWQEASVRLAALCRCGRCGGPRRWSFSAELKSLVFVFVLGKASDVSQVKLLVK